MYCHTTTEKLKSIGVDENIIFDESNNDSPLLKSVRLTHEQAVQLIPEGEYCYTRDTDGKIQRCPFWDIFKQMPKQDNGFCHFLNEGDWQSEGISLLWDQCKECGIKNYETIQD